MAAGIEAGEFDAPDPDAAAVYVRDGVHGVMTAAVHGDGDPRAAATGAASFSLRALAPSGTL